MGKTGWLPWRWPSVCDEEVAQAAGICGHTPEWSPCLRPGLQWLRQAVNITHAWVNMDPHWTTLFYMGRCIASTHISKTVSWKTLLNKSKLVKRCTSDPIQAFLTGQKVTEWDPMSFAHVFYLKFWHVGTFRSKQSDLRSSIIPQY